MSEISGRTAIVTGAASGIGLGIARALSARGAKVALADIRADAAHVAAAALANEGARTVALEIDVSDRQSVSDAADAAETALGPIQIAINNAGVAMHGVPLDRITPADWDWVVGVNIYGVIHGIQTFVPRIRAHGKGGHVVNTASIGGLQVNPAFLTGAYSMTKYAVVALSEALEQELSGTGIGVSVFCPAAVDTGIHLSERSRPVRLGGPTVRPENHFIGGLIEGGLPPREAGEWVAWGIENGEFFILPHTEAREWIDARHERVSKAFDAAEAMKAKTDRSPQRTQSAGKARTA